MYTRENLPNFMKTAGKVTMVTALAGGLVFMLAFVFDFSAQELNKVSAQSATTTLTVLNTPPLFLVEPYEVVESSTSSPTNSGDQVQWSTIAEDSNSAPYFLLVCSASVTPIANEAPDSNSLGTTPPECGLGAVQWAVSPAASSTEIATAATTTIDSADGPSDFSEVNTWFAWVCDDDPVSAECNPVPSQGLYSTSSSPFNVNSRPVLTSATNTGPVDPGDTLTFSSTSSDPDSVGGPDLLSIIVCSDDVSYNPTTNTCGAAEIASTTVPSATDATADRFITIPTQDQVYAAYVYLIDEHNHESAGPLFIQADFEVSNVAPTVLDSSISLNNGSNIILTEEGGETTGFVLDFTVTDNNSTLAANNVDPEIVDWGVSVYRTPNSTSTCNLTAGYDPNNCYTSGSTTATWNLNCTATSTTVLSSTSTDVTYNCTFPLWFVADPTDSGPFSAFDWYAAALGIDDDNATGTMTQSASSVTLDQLLGIGIVDAEIAYGAIAPGDNSGNLTATSVALNRGNTGLDQRVEGESMCGTFAIGNECVHTGTSTIPADQQQFSSTSSLPYNDPLAFTLSSTTLQELELNVPKTTSTSTFQQGTTYWGIAVPATITLAGDYRGLNSFLAEVTEDSEW